MRTFIAIPLSAEARALLDELQMKMRSFGADVRWTAVSSIHLTLKFLGEIEPAVLPRLVTLLRAAAASEQAFMLCLRGLGGFPNLRNPRVLWCGLEGDLQLLASLQQKVEQACLEAGFAPEERPFQPHLTLGRVRGKSNLQPLLDYIKIGSTVERAFGVKEFNVYQSILRPQGALYAVLEKIDLKGE
jgi:RNA 2',3'-cyclic 3'-phosphodiesterase